MRERERERVTGDGCAGKHRGTPRRSEELWLERCKMEIGEPGSNGDVLCTSRREEGLGMKVIAGRK